MAGFFMQFYICIDVEAKDLLPLCSLCMFFLRET